MKRIFLKKIKFGYENKKISDSLKKNKTFSMLSLLLLSGTILGIFCAYNADNETTERITSLFLINLHNKLESTVLENFIISLSSSFMFLMLPFMFGLSLWGSIFSPFITIFKGFGLGFCAGYMCCFYGIKGVSFYLLVLLPCGILSSIAVLLLCKESIRFSVYLFLQTFPKFSLLKTKDYSSHVYLLRSGFCFMLIVIASALEILCTNVFAGLFRF